MTVAGQCQQGRRIA